MAEFKVNDRVIIKNRDGDEGSIDIGKVGTVLFVDEDAAIIGESEYEVRFDDHDAFVTAMFELSGIRPSGGEVPYSTEFWCTAPYAANELELVVE